MKRLFTILVALTALFILTACNSATKVSPEDAQQEILGVWQMENEFNESGSEDNTETAGIVTVTYDFREDGTYTQVTSATTYAEETSDNVGSEVVGTYKLDGDEITLTIETIGGESEEQYNQRMQEEFGIDASQFNAFGPQTFKYTLTTEKLTLDAGDYSYELNRVESE